MNSVKLKIIAAIFGVVIIIGAGCARSEMNEQQTKTGPIKIGFVSALSGNAAEWGSPTKEGFKFAIKEINENGGMDGRKLEVIYEDSKCETKIGLNAVNRLLNIENTKIITGSVCSSVAMTLGPKIQKKGGLYIASGATHPKVTKTGNNVFRLWVSDAYEANRIAEYATEKLNHKKFAVGYFNDNPAGIALKNNFKKSVVGSGGEIVETESYASDENDVQTIITKLISDNPDALYLVSTPNQTPLLVNTARQLGYGGDILLYGPSAKSKSAENIDQKDGIYYVIPQPQKKTDFWKKFKKNKNTKASQLNALGYDSAKLIADGLQECGEDIECIKKYYQSLNSYKTTRGNFGFDSSGNLKNVEFEIKQL